MVKYFLAMIVLGGCGNESSEEPNQETSTNQSDMNNSEMEHSHSSSAEVPDGLQEAKDPAYPVGSKVILQTDHMEGMNGAEATVVKNNVRKYYILF